jgi:hypothetical protein
MCYVAPTTVMLYDEIGKRKCLMPRDFLVQKTQAAAVGV